MKIHFHLFAYASVASSLLLSGRADAQRNSNLLRVYHLGDSFSAGNGARDLETNSERSYVEFPECHRSTGNWGNRFAQSFNSDYNSVQFVNRACSGGVIGDITNQRVLDNSFQWPVTTSRAVGRCDVHPWDGTLERLPWPRQNTCRVTLRPQIDNIYDDPNADTLILLTIGGNDAKFADIIYGCFVPVFAGQRACKTAIDFAKNYVSSRYLTELTDTLRQIHEKAPNARIVLSSYPHLTLEDQPWAWGDFDAKTELRRLANNVDDIQNEIVSDLNREATQNSESEYIHFYDGTKAAFATHEPDPRFLVVNPQRYIWEVEFVTSWQAENYHTHPDGHVAWAQGLESLRPTLLDSFSNLPRQRLNTTNDDGPTAIVDEAMVGRINEPIAFDASQSFDQDPEDSIVSYEWDFDGDGTIDLTTDSPFADYTYTEEFGSTVSLTVTSSDGESTVVNMTVQVNEEGTAVIDELLPCPLDENGYSIPVKNGAIIDCDVTSPPPQVTTERADYAGEDTGATDGVRGLRGSQR